MTRNFAMYRKLFTSTFYLSAFTFGGGFVIIPLMKKTFVDDLGWLEEDEMLNLAAIAQSSPGAVAVNASILVGFRIGGPLGALISILGTVLGMLIIAVMNNLLNLMGVPPFLREAFKGFIVIAAVLLQKKEAAA